jgi:predicted nucleotidyltransferase
MKSNLNIIQKEEILGIDPDSYKELLMEIKNFFRDKKSEFSKVDSIILFGSYALKNYKKNSDIDLCVVFKSETPRNLETDIFGYFLDLSKRIDILIDVIFIYPEQIDTIDHTLLESILAEGQLLYGNENSKELLLKNIKLQPYQIITFNLKNINRNDKMKFKRMLYGYKTSREYSRKKYNYHREGLIHKVKGQKLGSGTIIIPEENLPLIEKEFKAFNINFINFRVWKQKI